MGRPRQRVNLNDGLRLDLNRLMRRGNVRSGSRTGGCMLRWSWVYTDETIATATISADMTDPDGGWVRIVAGGLDQYIHLRTQPRHFGGHQWYFLCPITSKLVSVVWLPPGAKRFASRHAWRRQVAYGSQFESRHNRALATAQRIRCRLAGPEWGGLDGLDPPKPKWMRRRTYERLLERSWKYEQIADERLTWLVGRLSR